MGGCGHCTVRCSLHVTVRLGSGRMTNETTDCAETLNSMSEVCSRLRLLFSLFCRPGPFGSNWISKVALRLLRPPCSSVPHSSGRKAQTAAQPEHSQHIPKAQQKLFVCGRGSTKYIPYFLLCAGHDSRARAKSSQRGHALPCVLSLT